MQTPIYCHLYPRKIHKINPKLSTNTTKLYSQCQHEKLFHPTEHNSSPVKQSPLHQPKHPSVDSQYFDWNEREPWGSRIRAERKDDKKECSFNKLPPHRKQMILNASTSFPFTKAAENPTEFYENLLTEKSTFKFKELIDHELFTTQVKHFKVSPALAAAILIGDLISNDLNPSNLSIWFCLEWSHSDSKESKLNKGLWIMDGKHVQSDIQILSKTSIYIPDGIMVTYFMLLNFKTIFTLFLERDAKLTSSF